MWTAQLQNTQQTVNALDILESTYQTLGSLLDQLNTLVTQALSTTESPTDRQSLPAEVTALLQQMTAVTTATTVNGQAAFALSFTETRMGSTAPTVSSDDLFEATLRAFLQTVKELQRQFEENQ